MKIGIQAYGTRGDIRPFIALANGLSQAGHEVTMAYTSPEKYDFSPFLQNGNVKIIQGFSEACYDDEKNLNSFTPEQIGEYFDRLETYVFPASAQLCRDNDFVIGSSGSYYLICQAEKANVPFVSMNFDHSILPTKYAPPPGWPDSHGEEGNLYFWGMINEGSNKEHKEFINSFRQKVGLPPVENILLEMTHSSKLHLLGISSIFSNQHPDWENRCYVCGYLFPDQFGEAEPLSVDLMNFINAGSKPVFLTVGSQFVFIKNREDFVNTLIEAAALVGRRAIVQANWDLVNLEAINDNPNVFKVGYDIVHRNVFPYCEVVVHHGGAGTTHTATLCGCPSVVLEYGGDMPLWGNELKRLGIAPDLLHGESVTATDIARELKIVLESKDMKRKAEELGKIIEKENAIQRAVEVIENHLHILQPSEKL